MPYLSRIWINPLRRDTQRLLRSPQAMRAAVLGGIPNQPVAERVLWRLDSDEPRRPSLFVVSQSKPSWEHLVEQAGWPAADEPQAQTRDYQPLLTKLADQQTFAFRLAANPAQSTKKPINATPAQLQSRQRAPRRSVVVGHRTVAHQLRWLLDRVAAWGVQLPDARTDAPAVGGDKADAGTTDTTLAPPDVRIVARRRVSFARNDGGHVTFEQVTYEGHLRVVDPERLAGVLIAGVGKAKAYGCGLLTLAPSTRLD